MDDLEKLIAAAKCVQERGAYKIYVVATHGIFCSNACELLSNSPITEVGNRRQTCYIEVPHH